MLGDGIALAAVLGVSLLMLGAAIVMVAPRFADCAIAAAGTTSGRPLRAAAGFRPASPIAMLRRKEWALLRRDPWLVSQTLMQMLYLLPPAFLLWRSFESGSTNVVLLVPVLVMAAGQLAGGLAWLAISGEDAPDLIATAPLTAHQVVRAKIEAVMGCIALVFSPFMLPLALVGPLRRRGRRARHCRSRGVGDRHPALLSRPGEAQPVPPPPDLVACRDLRRGVLVDRLGRRGRTGRCRNLDGGDPRDHRRRHPGGHKPGPPAGGIHVTGAAFSDATRTNWRAASSSPPGTAC